MPLADDLDTFFSRSNQHDASDGVSRQTRTSNQVLTVDEQLVTSIWWRANPPTASGAAGSSETVRLSWSQSSPDRFSGFWTCSQLVDGVLNNPHSPRKKTPTKDTDGAFGEQAIQFSFKQKCIKIKSIIGCFEIANPCKNKVTKCIFLGQSYAVSCTVYNFTTLVFGWTASPGLRVCLQDTTWTCHVAQ